MAGSRRRGAARPELRWQLATCAAGFVAAAGWAVAATEHVAKSHLQRHIAEHHDEHRREVGRLRARAEALEAALQATRRPVAEVAPVASPAR